MRKTLIKFFTTEDGAVSIDWVVITAAVVAIGVAMTAAFRPVMVERTNAISPIALSGNNDTSF